MRVILGTDQQLFADALQSTLSAHGVTVAGWARSPHELIREAVAQLPQICLISARWLVGNGAQLFDVLHPAIQIVALAEAADAALTAALRGTGVAAVVSQNQHVVDLIEILHRVRAGERPVPAVRTRSAVRALRPSTRSADGGLLDGLTLREQEVLMLIADGHATRDIAQALAISLHTARTHVQSVLVKLGAHSRLEASGMVARSGLLGLAVEFAVSRAAAQ
jgi:two-component system, NarL family, nitrate/nitrite response regulator NarL